MSHDLHIKGSDAQLSILVLGYEQEQETTGYDANWLRCQAHLKIGAWESLYPFTCLTSDLAISNQQLEELVSGASRTAQFKPMEPELAFTLEVIDASNVRVAGSSKLKIKKTTSLDTACQFTFVFPLSEVENIAAALRSITKAYPVRGVIE